MREDSSSINKQSSMICTACKGKIKQAYGYKWEYSVN